MAKNWLTALVTGDHKRIAELAVAEGRLKDAIAAYTKGGHYLEAARLAEEQNQRADAVELYIRAVLGKDADMGEASAQQAGELLVVSGQYKDALLLFEAAKAWKQAADMCLKVGQHARAARLYERAGLWAPAATNFEKVDQFVDAVRMLDKEAQRLLDEPVRDASHRERVRVNDLKRAELMAKLGRNAEAAVLYRGLGMDAKAAVLLEKAGQVRDAVEAYLAAGQPQLALHMVERAPTLDPKLVAETYRRVNRHLDAAQLFLGMDKYGDAASCFELAGELGRAGELWEKAKQPLRAGAAYQRANRPRDAARCFEEAGSHSVAAEAYAQAGDNRAAARAYSRASMPYRAGLELLKIGQKNDAARELQEVDPKDGDFEKATLELAPLLIDDGMAEAALHRLRALPDKPKGGQPVLLDKLYWEGRALEGLGRALEAELAYQKVLSINRRHRDVASRMPAIEKASAAARTAIQQAVVTGNTTALPQLAEVLATQASALGLNLPSMPLTEAKLPQGMVAARLPRLDELGPGDTLAGRYEILAEIGRGGMGRVYKARDREMDELLAIKTLIRSGEGTSAEEERLLREAQICRRITHPNVVRVHDIGRLPTGIFVTMEYVAGETLEELLEHRPGPSMPLGRIRTILIETASGLREAHALQVVHRDLKPSNLMLTDTRLKILDFGIARIADAENRLTRTGFAVGTPAYMSPEQIRGTAVDGRSDLYALGIIAYRLLAGVEPFQADNPTTVAIAHLQQQPPDLDDYRPGLPAEWKNLVAKLLAKNPDERFQSADEVIAAVQALPGTDHATPPPDTKA